MDIEVNNLTVTDIINFAEFLERRAEHYRLQGDYHNQTATAIKAQEYGAIAEIMVQEGVKNTINKAPSLLPSTVGLRFDKLPQEVTQYKQLSLPLKKEKEKAPVSEEEQKENEEIHENAALKAREFDNLEADFLTRKREKNKEEDNFVTTYRTVICKMIADGDRNQLVNILTDYVFRHKENYTPHKAHQFINAMKEQFQIEEPGKNLKKNNNRSIPSGKWIYAEYNTRESSGEKKNKGYLRRGRGQSIEMFDVHGHMVCHTVDLHKWRIVNRQEKEEIKNAAPF